MISSLQFSLGSVLRYLSLTFLFFLTSAQASPAPEVAAANSHYQIGDFQKAKEAYLNLLNLPQYSNAPLLYYNLGNTHYRLGDTGQAILAYRRALHFSDQDLPEARQNLRFLKDKTAYLTFATEPLSEFCARFMPETLRVVWILCCWVVGLILAVLIVIRLTILWKAPLAILSVLTLILLVLAVIGENKSSEYHRAQKRLRLVVTDGVRAHTAPATTSSEIFELPPGSEVRLINERGSWSYVDILKDTRAWVLTRTLEPLITPPVTDPAPPEGGITRSVLN